MKISRFAHGGRTATLVALATAAALLAGCQKADAPDEAQPPPVATASEAAQAQAQDHQGGAAHPTAEHVHPVHPKLELDADGRRWQTDEPLRAGMQRIRDAVAPYAGTAPQAPSAEQGRALATTVRDQVQYLIENCKLDPKADATLHALIGDLLAGAQGLEADPTATDGIPLIVEALEKYPQYFDHPGWQPLA